MKNVIDLVKPCNKCGAQDRSKTGLCRPCASAYSAKHYADGKGAEVKKRIVQQGPRLVLGHGVSSKGLYAAIVDSKRTREDILWRNMLIRCYSIAEHKRYPTYLGCEASAGFKDFQVFAEWCQGQVGFSKTEFVLDKDILLAGNKVYGEDTCVFLPREVNGLLIGSDAKRGAHPIGVTAHKDGGYVSSCNMFGLKTYLGYFPTVVMAFAAYKTAKEAHIKVVAEQWKDQIDPRAYAALMSYEILITD